MKKIILVITALPVLLTLACRAQSIDSLRSFVRNIDAFNRLFPQEKVYLHFDNTGYFRGETMWFSAYVVRTDRQRLTDMSRVLYVELLDPTGEIVETRKLKLDGGRGSGSIKLDKLLTSGFYEVRAYTRYMLNWDAAWAFSRVIPVFNAPKKEGDYANPVITEPDYRKRLPSSRQKDDVEREAVNVAFYPEGGRLVLGLHSRVAFSVTDRDGRPLDAVGRLMLPDGSAIAVKTLHEGRGVFDITPSGMPAKLVLTDRKGRTHEFALPPASAEGCVLSADVMDSCYINVSVMRTAGFKEPLALVLVNGGNVDATDIVSPEENTARRRFRKSEMAAGVSQLALVGRDGRIVAERMVFIYPQDGLDTMSVSVGGALSPCGKVALNVKTLPGAVFSLSVRDRASEVNGQAGNAATWLLLASDLRGYIHEPEYYLEADDAEHRRAADLLMMVQGWRRYELPVMAGCEAFVRKHPVEDGLYLYGKLYKVKKEYKTGGVNLKATLYNRAGESMDGVTRTDTAGRYSFCLPDCEGEWTLLLNTAKGGKAAKYRIGIDRNFSPAPRQLSYLETERIESAGQRLPTTAEADLDTEAEQPSMSERVHILKEVKVKGKGLFENARAAWETEQRGAYSSYLRYDCDKVADEIYDRGGETPSIFEWLAAKNSFFGGSASDMEEVVGPSTYSVLDNLYGQRAGSENSAKQLLGTETRVGHYIFSQDGGFAYKNRPVVWILNNRYYLATQTSKAIKIENFDIDELNGLGYEMMDVDLDDFKSVYISEDENVWRKYISIDNLDRRSPVTVFLYSHHSFPARHKGLRHTYFEGYSKVETFQMPDYSLMPKEVDHRRTLYWNPAVKADGKGEAKVEFYNNSSCKELVVSAEGITADGQAVVFK